MIWDGFGLLAGSMFAFMVVNRVAGFRSGLAAAVAVLLTFALGPNWYSIGRGLSEISALMWIYVGASCVLAALSRRPALASVGGLFGILGSYTRMNHLPLVLALGALSLFDGVEAGAAFDLRRVWARLPKRVVAWYYAAVAIGLCAFAARTWYYTGRFSLFAGTSLGFNAIGLGTTLDSWWSADAWRRAIASLMMLVTVQDPPRFDIRSVLVVAGVALSLLAIARVPRVRRLPLGLTLVCLAAISGGLVVRGSAYPGRFSAPPHTGGGHRIDADDQHVSPRRGAVATYILGLSAYYHDSAACLVVDGEIVAAAQEERFTRKKHDAGVPDARGRTIACAKAASTAERSTSSASTRSRWSSSSGCSRPTSRARRAGCARSDGDAALARPRSCG